MNRRYFIFALLFLTLIIIGVGVSHRALAAYTYEDSLTVSGKGSFSSAWEYSYEVHYGMDEETTQLELAIIAVGYDTDWINEDYTWTKATIPGFGVYSKAGVRKSGNWNYGSWKGLGTWSKVEVQHKSNPAYKITIGTNNIAGNEWHDFIMTKNQKTNSNYK